MNHQSLGLPEIDLLRAMRQDGCPLCHLQQAAEARYLRHLLAENVTDPTSRQRIRQSLGFCTRHAWQMAATEIAEFGSPLGTATICSDLIRAAKDQLARTYCAAVSGPGSSSLARSFIPAAFRRPRPFRILKRRLGCRVCQIGAEAAGFHAHSLLQCLSDEDACVEGVLNGSAHLCLPHLDLTLRLARRETLPAVLWLVRATLDRLGQLETDLEEYAGKHAWDRRGEPMTAAEETSWRSGLAFLAGEPRPGER